MRGGVKNSLQSRSKRRTTSRWNVKAASEYSSHLFPVKETGREKDIWGHELKNWSSRDGKIQSWQRYYELLKWGLRYSGVTERVCAQMWRREGRNKKGGKKGNTCLELIELTFSISSMLGPSSCSSSIPVIAALLNTSYSISLWTRPRRSLIHSPGHYSSLSSSYGMAFPLTPFSPRAWGVIVLCWNRWCFIGACSPYSLRYGCLFFFCFSVPAEPFHCNAPDESHYCSAVFLQTANDGSRQIKGELCKSPVKKYGLERLKKTQRLLFIKVSKHGDTWLVLHCAWFILKHCL